MNKTMWSCRINLQLENLFHDNIWILYTFKIKGKVTSDCYEKLYAIKFIA